MGNGFIPGDLLADAKHRDPYRSLIDALETARKEVCIYMGPTCDCKWGLIPPDDPAEVVPLAALNCRHNHCEHTGCPELRTLVGQVRRSQRAWWAARSDKHEATPTHDMPCCDRVLLVDPPASGSCGGPHYCAVCVTEADRTHGLLPPLADS